MNLREHRVEKLFKAKNLRASVYFWNTLERLLTPRSRGMSMKRWNETMMLILNETTFFCLIEENILCRDRYGCVTGNSTQQITWRENIAPLLLLHFGSASKLCKQTSKTQISAAKFSEFLKRQRENEKYLIFSTRQLDTTAAKLHAQSATSVNYSLMQLLLYQLERLLRLHLGEKRQNATRRGWPTNRYRNTQFFPVHGVAQQSQGGILRGLAQIHAWASVGASAMDQGAMSLSP
jgi:hypothetical protein